MMNRMVLVTLIVLVVGIGPARGQDSIQLELVAEGFERPSGVVGTDDGRLYVLEQFGTVRIVETDGRVSPIPFLIITDRTTYVEQPRTYWAQGLLGLAFHPDYARNGRIFLNYTNLRGDTIIAEMATSLRGDVRVAEPDTETVYLTIEQPYDNHNSGDMHFGPDGYLYVALGDGGWRVGQTPGDPRHNAQDTTTLLGSLLRLDVDNPAEGLPYGFPPDNPFVEAEGRPEIWAWGLRYPWRFSFDRATGDLYIADVGHYLHEEVNVIAAGDPGGNFGWPAYEGSQRFNETNGTPTWSGPPPADAIAPTFDYVHSGGRCSITGGYVYRGAAIPWLVGAYLYSDFCSGDIWAARQSDDGSWSQELLLRTNMAVAAFGQDVSGELYVLTYHPTNGGLYRVVPGTS